jgi:DNA-binding MarR family transcriptional regulator
MMRGISRHDEIMKYIKDCKLYYNRMPTRKEIMFDCKMTRGALQRLIYRLEEKGRLERLPKGILEFKVVK